MFKKITEIVHRINEKYENANVLLGGDFNDTNPPKTFGNLKRRDTKSYTRFNTMERNNTKIDYIYSNFETQVGTIGVLRPYKEIQNYNKSIRSRL